MCECTHKKLCVLCLCVLGSFRIPGADRIQQISTPAEGARYRPENLPDSYRERPEGSGNHVSPSLRAYLFPEFSSGILFTLHLSLSLFGPKRKMTSAIARWHSNARPPSDALEQAYADQLEAEMQEMAIQLHKVHTPSKLLLIDIDFTMRDFSFIHNIIFFDIIIF